MYKQVNICSHHTDKGTVVICVYKVERSSGFIHITLRNARKLDDVSNQ